MNHSFTIQPEPHRSGSLRNVLLLVAVLALTARLAFVFTLLRYHSADEIQATCADSAEYLHLANNLVTNGVYVTDDPISHHTALARPPGYPLFCAAFNWTGLSTPGILVTQALLGCWIAIATAILAAALLHSRLAGCLAGVASALSPTGIGLTGVLLADLLFAAVLLVGLLLFYYGIAHTRSGMTIASGAVFGLAAMIKPALVVWPLALPVIGWLFARSARVPMRFRPVLACIALQLVFIGAWTIRNGLSDGCYTPSIIGPKNLRYYVTPRVEAWAQAGHMPKGSTILRFRTAAWDRDTAELAAGTTTSAQIVQRQYAESLAVFQAHPAVTLRVYLQNMKEGLTEGWGYFPAQLPAGTAMRSGLDLLNRIVRKVHNPLLQLACFGMVVMVLAALLRRDDASRSSLFGALALVITIAMFVALSGTTFWTGSRILYPCEFALIMLPIGGVLAALRIGACLWKTSTSMITRSSPIS